MCGLNADLRDILTLPLVAGAEWSQRRRRCVLQAEGMDNPEDVRSVGVGVCSPELRSNVSSYIPAPYF